MKLLVAVLGALGLMLISSGATFAAAGGNTANPGNDQGYNPPAAAVASCDSGHGAFGAFSHNTGTWIPTDAREDGGLGSATGPANSDYSQYCQTQTP